MDYWKTDSKLLVMPQLWSTARRITLVHMRALLRIVPLVNHNLKSSISSHILISSEAPQTRSARQMRVACRIWMPTYNRLKLWTNKSTHKTWPSLLVRRNSWPQIAAINLQKRRIKPQSSMKVRRARSWSLMSISMVYAQTFLTTSAKSIILQLLRP